MHLKCNLVDNSQRIVYIKASEILIFEEKGLDADGLRVFNLQLSHLSRHNVDVKITHPESDINNIHHIASGPELNSVIEKAKLGGL